MAESTLTQLLERLAIDSALAIYLIFLFLLQHLIVICWFAWWLAAANWSRIWPVLMRGGWIIVMLACLTGAMVWSQISPLESDFLGFAILPNFIWQLAAVACLILATLGCGWLQGIMNWKPAEIDLNPSAPAMSHDALLAHH